MRDFYKHIFFFGNYSKAFCLLFLFLLVGISGSNSSMALGTSTFTTNGVGTNWATAANWTPVGASTSTYPGEIAGNIDIVIMNNNMTLGASVPNSISTLTINGVILTTINRNITCSGLISGTGTITKSTATITAQAGINISTLTFSGAGALTVTGDITVGTLTCFSTNAISLTGNWGVTTFTKATSTVTFNGGVQNINTATDFYNVTLSVAGNKTLAAPITVSNNLNNSAGILISDIYQITGGAGTFTIGAAASFSLGNIGDATDVTMPVYVTYTFSAGSTVTYQNNATQTVAGLPSYSNLVIATGGTKILDGGSATLTVARNLTVSAGTFDLGITCTTVNLTGASPTYIATITGTLKFNGPSLQTVTITGDLGGAGTIDMSTNNYAHVLVLNGSTTSIGTLTTSASANSVVQYNRNGTQTVFASDNYRNLIISNNNIKTLMGNSLVNNDLIIMDAANPTFTFGGAYTLGVSGNLSMNPNNLAGNYIVNVNTGALTLAGTVLSGGTGGTNTQINITSGSAAFTKVAGWAWPAEVNLTVSLAGSATWTAPLTLNTTATFLTISGADGVLTFNGLVSHSDGTIRNTGAAGIINFNAGYNRSNALATFTTLALETINFGGDFTNNANALVFNTTSYSVFNANTPNIYPTTAITFGNFKIESAVTVTLNGDISVANDWTNNNGVLTTDIAARTVTFMGIAGGAGNYINGTSATTFPYLVFSNNLGTVSVTLDVDASCTKLYIGLAANAGSVTLTHGVTNPTLTVNGTADISQPNGNGTRRWNIYGGAAVITGTLTFTGTDNTGNRAEVIEITTGSLAVTGALSFDSNSWNAAQTITITGSGLATFTGVVQTLATGILSDGVLSVTDAGTMTFSSYFNMEGGTVSVSATGTLNFTKTGAAFRYTSNSTPTFTTADGSVLNFNGDLTTVALALTFANGSECVFTADATITPGAALTIGNLTINPSVTLNLVGGNITVTNDWTNSGVAFNHGNNTVTLSGIGQQTITKSGGTETFYNLTCASTLSANSTTIVLEASTDLTVTNTLTMQSAACIFNLNGRTFTLGSSGGASTLTGPSAARWMYGGTFKRFWPNGATITVAGNNYGTFPMGTVDAATYRPLTLVSTGAITADAYYTVNHVDAGTVTDLSVAQPEAITRVSDAQFLTTTSGNAFGGGTYTINVQMNGLSTTGAAIGANLHLAVSTGATTVGVVGTHVATTGSATAPLVKRNLVTVAELNQNNDFRVSTLDNAGHPLRDMFYSRASGGNMYWTNSTTWSTTGCNGAAGGSAPTANAYVTICTGDNVIIDVNSTADYVVINTGGILSDLGAAITFTVNKDITTAGSGVFTPTSSAAWTVTRNATLAGSGTSSTTGAFNVTGNLAIGAGTTLNIGGNSTVAGNLSVDGTLGIGANTLTLSGATKTISGSAGAATINGTGGTIDVTAGNKTISAGSALTIVPDIYISNAGVTTTITNRGTVTLNNNLRGIHATRSRWTNAANSTLNIGGALFTTTLGLFSNAAPNLVNYNGVGNQDLYYNLGGSYTYNQLKMSTSGTKNMLGHIYVTSSVTIQDAAICQTNNFALIGAGDFVMSGTSELQTQRQTTIPELTGTYNITGGTLTFTGSGNQNLRALNAAPSAYYNVTVASTVLSTVTMLGNTTIQNNLTIAGGAFGRFSVSGTAYTLNIGGNWNVTSTAANPFTESTGIVNFSGTAPQTITTVLVAGETFYDVNFNNTVGVTFDNGTPATVTDNLTINSLAVLNGGTNILNVRNNWINNGGTFNPGTGTVTFNGTGAQSITKASAETFNNLTIATSGLKTTNCDLSLAGNLAIGTPGGTAQLDMNTSNYNLSVAGDWTVTSTNANPFVERSGTVTFNGSALQTITTVLAAGETFYNLNFTNNIGGARLTVRPITVSNDITFNNAALFDANGFNIALKGNWVNNSGTFTPGAGTVTLSGTGPQTITKTSGTETFNNLTSNTIGPITLEASTDVTVNTTLNMTAGLFDLNGRTFTLGTNGVASTLTRTASSTTNWVYGGTFKRFWPDNTALTISNYGLFPMGTSSASSYRPVEISTSSNTATDGYFTVNHVDASTSTDLSPTGPESFVRISDAQFLTAVSGLTGGVFNINVTMTGLSSVGTTPLDILGLGTFAGGTTAGIVGTHLINSGTPANPTVKRTGVTITELNLNSDFRVATTNTSSDPLRSFYYSRKTGNWDDVTPGDGTWSLTSGGAGPSCDCVPPASAYVVISAGHTVTVSLVTTIANVDIETGATLNGGSDFTVSKDLTIAGTGKITPTAGTWVITRNATFAGTGISSCAGAFNVTGNLAVGSGTSLTLGTSSSVTGNLSVDGTLDIGITTLTLNGSSGKTISGSAGASSIAGTGGTLNITVANKTISTGTNLTIAPVFAINGAFTITNNGAITLADNLTGTVAGSTWTNAANSTLIAGATLLATGTLNASANGSIVNYNGGGAQSVKIPSSSTYYNLTISNAGTKTFATAGTITVTNLFTLSDAAIFDVSTNTFNGVADLTMSGTSELKLARSATQPELTGAYTISGGTITLYGAGIQTVRSLNAAPSAYYNIDFGGTTGAGVKSLAGAITVQGELKISGTAQLDVSASNFAITVAGNWNVSGTNANPFIEQSGTVTFNGGSAQTITPGTTAAAETFKHLIINNSAGVSLLSFPITVSGNLTISSGALLDANTQDINIAGNWVDNGGSFLCRTRTVTFNGTTQSITKSSTATFYNTIFSTSGIKTLGCDLAVNNFSILNTAQVDVSASNYAISVTGNWAVTSTNLNPFVERGGTTSFIGTTAQTIATVLAAGETFYNFVTTNNSVGIQLDNPINVSGNLTINSGVLFLGNGKNISLAGNWTNSGGTFTPGTGTLTLTGSADKMITNILGESFYNLTSNSTGIISFESNTDVIISSQLTMTAGNFNLNGRTLTLGNGSGAALVFTAGIVYGGNFKRYLDGGAISNTIAPRAGLFPIGTSTDYRPVEIISGTPASPGYLSASHTDASTVTDVTYTESAPAIAPFDAIQRITDMKSTLVSSGGLSGGTYSLNVTMTGLSNTGVTLANLKLETYTSSVMGSAGAVIATTGSFAAPTVGRSGLALTDLENDFVIGTKDLLTEPLQQFFYSRNGGGLLTTASTWSTVGCNGGASGSAPAANAHLTICNGDVVTVDAVSTVAYVDINAGGTLDGTFNFTVTKDLTTAGTGIFAPTAGNWTISRNATLVGTGSSNLSGTSTVTGNLSIGAGTILTMNGGAGLTVAGNLTVDGTLALGTSTATLSGSAKTISGSGGAASITTGAGGTLNITSNKTIPSGTTLSIAPVFAITGAFTVANSGSITLTGNLTGSVAGSTWTNAASATLNAGDALLTTGTLNASALGNTVNYTKAGAQSVKIPAASTYYNLSLSTSGTKTFATVGTISVSNLVTIQDAAMFDVSTNTLSGAGGLTMSGTTELLLAKLSTTLPELTGTYNLTDGTIRFNGAGAQTIRSLNAAAPAAYYNVDFGGTTGSGVKTLAGAISVQGVLNITGTAQLDASASNYAINIAGNWNNAGTNANPFIERSGTVTFNGTAAQTIVSSVLLTETFDNLVINNTSGVTLLNHINVTSPTSTGNSLTIQSGALLVTTTYNIGLTGDWINNGGTFTPGTAMVTFNGNSAQSITKASSSTFYDITFSNSGTTTLACNLVVQRDLLIAGTAKLDVSGTFYSIDVARHWTVTSTLGDPFAERSGTVTFNGAAGQNQSTVLAAGETFYNLIINNPIGVTLNSGGVIPTNVSNLLTISSSAFLLGNNHNINIAGSWTNSGGTYTPGATGTVTFNGTGTQTITRSGGTETFNNLITNTTGPLTLEASTDVTVSNALTMTSGLYNLNGRTLTLGTSGVASTLTRTASSTTNWVYGGTLKRFWPNGATLTIADYGLFPMGTSTASSYRPVEISTTGGITTDGYFTVNHLDAATVTDLTVSSESMARISDAQFTTAISGVTAGTFAINVTMTGLSTTGTVPLDVLGLAIFTGGTTASVVGTHLINTGTPANPTVKRTGITTMSDLNNDFRVATTNVLTDPLQQLYYSRKTGNWNDATPGDGTWSLTSGGAGVSCDCVPPTNGYAVISTGNTVSVNVISTIAYVSIETGATLDGTSNFTVSKDLTTAGNGNFAPTAGAWTITRDATLVGTGNSSLSGISVITGNLSVGAGTTLTMNGGVSLGVAGNLTVDGTLALGTSIATLSGSAKTISGSVGAASITTGVGGTINVTANKTIPSGTILNIAPVFAIIGAFTVTNNGTITLTGNLTGSAAGSTWTNASSSTLNAGEALLSTGTLNASAIGNTVNYNKAGAQSVKIPAASTYYNLSLSTSGTKSFATAGTISVSNLVTIQGAATIFNVSTNTLNGVAGLTMTGTSELLLAKLATTLPELTGSYSLSGGTIRFNGAGAQTIRSLNAAAPAAYYNVDFGTSGVKTLAGAISVQGVLNITLDAQLDVSASNYAIGLAGNWNNAGTNANPFIERSGTVTFNGTAAQTIVSSVLLTETFDNLVISNTSGVTLLNHINVTSPTSTGNSLTIQSGALLVTTTYNIGLTGDWINNGGTFTPGTAMVTFNGNSAQSITKASSSTFYDITFSNSGTTTLACNLVVQRDLLIAGTAKLDVSGTFYSIDVARHWTVTSTLGDPFAERSGTVTFNGAAGQNQSTVLAAGETFYNLIINNPIGVTLNSGGVIPTNVSNLLTISLSAVLLGNNHNINIAGSWTNSGGLYTPGATGTVTFNGTGTQTITKTGGTETFNNLITNTTGPLTLEASTDVTVSNALTMTSGLYNLNGRTLTLGTSGVASTLTRTASSTTNWVYGGTLKRFWPNGATLTIADYGLFPMGTSTASSYRPVEISTTGGITTDGYFTVNHLDAATVTDLTVGSESMARISDAQFTTAISGVTAGTFAINVTMTGLSTTGTVPLDVLGLAIFTGGTTASVVGTHLINTGTPANPTVKRTGITTMSDLNNDFRVATTNVLTDPLQQLYYSRKTGNWNDATPGDATWSLVSGGAGASCDCTPPANAYAVISTGNTVSVNVVSSIAYVSIETGATLNGTSNFNISKDLITAGTGIFAPTAGAWTISRNATLVGTGSSNLSGTTTITGNLGIGSGTTLTMNGGVGLTVAGNLTVDGTLALGTSTATLSGSAKTISGSGGAASITTGAGGTLNITSNKTIPSGTTLSIAPVFAITGAFTVANSGTITLTGNLTGSIAGSTWTNATSSTLNAAGTVLTTGTLNASAVNTVNYNLAGAQSIKNPASSYYNLNLSNSGTKTFATAGTISVSNLVTISGSVIFDVSTNTLSGAAGLAMSGTSELLLAKLSTTLPELSGTATYNLTGGTIRFKGAGAQTVRSLNAAAPAAYYNVDFGGTTGSGVKTLAGAISVQGVLNITGTAQLDVSASNYAINIAGNWNNAGTNANPFIEQSGTVTFNGTAAQTIVSSVLLTETFDNLVINNTSGVTLLNHINVTSPTSTGNSLTIQSGALLVTTTYNIGLTGDWINNGGTFTPGTAMVTFNGNSAQSITKASSSTFYDITFSNSGTTTLACNLVVQRDLLIAGTAKLDVSGTFYSIDVARHWTVTSTLGDPFAERSGTVTFNGAAGQNQSTVLAAGETFYNLIINNPIGVTLNSGGVIPTNVSNLLTISSSAFLLGNNHNINIAGSWTNNGGTYTPGATGTVTFNGTGTQTITNTAGETFNNLITNTTGPLTLEASTDVTVSNTLTMTAGLYNLNGRTLTLGTSGVASALTRTASSTTNWVYGGTFKRFWLNAVNITSTSGNYYGLFPMGTSNASSYRPVEINATGVTTDGYFTVNHVDAATITDLTVGSESMTRISDAQFTTAISGVSAGTFAVNVTMTGLSTTGTVPLDVLGLAIFTGGTTASVVGTHLINTGTPANPTVKRTGITTMSDLNNDFRVATTNISTDPLQQLYYSRKTGNWNDVTPGNGTWSLTSGGAGASCDCVPPTNGFAVISAGNTVSVNVVSTIAYLNIEAGATLNGTSNFTISKDLTTAGSGLIAPTAGTFSVRNVTLVGTGSSALSGTSTISGNLSLGAGTTLTMNGGASLGVAGNLTVDGTLALGTSTATLSGSAKTISGSTGAASITGASATISVTANKTIPSGTTLSITPVFAITGAFTVTNNGTITLTGNLTGSVAGSTWTNAASSTLNAGGTVLTTGTLNASANNTVYYNAAGAQTVKTPASTYYNVEFGTSGIKTLAGAISVQTQLKISGTAQLYVSASNYAISLTGDWVNNGGTFTSGTGTVTFNGTGAQAINGTSASQTFYNLTQAKTAATALTVGGSTTTLTVNNLIQTSGDFNAAAASTALNINGSLTLTDGTFTAPSTTNIKGDWTKAIAATFTPGAGTVTFTGTAAAQSITGTAATTFTNLTFNNTFGTAPQITLAQPVTVTGAATFTDGIVASTATNLLILNDNATCDGGSSISYVDGPVKKIGNEAFSFPIGDGLIWARLGITAPASATTSYTAQYINAAYTDLTVDATLDHVSSLEYWTLEQAVNNDDVTVTLYWENASRSVISDCADLTIGHYDGTNFVEETATTFGGSSCTGAGTGSISTNAAVVSYVNKQFTFASNTVNNVLPIELLSFNAILRKDNKVAITWVTATEINNDYFTVERTSDGINYQSVALVKGAGNSAQVLNYATLDTNPFIGVAYYRLKQTDFDGQYKYSDLVSVYFENSEEFSVFPNPSFGKTYLKIDKIEKGHQVLIVIEDVLGHKIYSKTVVVEKNGETITAIDSNQKLPSGIYFISATTDDVIYRKKLVIQQ